MQMSRPIRAASELSSRKGIRPYESEARQRIGPITKDIAETEDIMAPTVACWMPWSSCSLGSTGRMKAHPKVSRRVFSSTRCMPSTKLRSRRCEGSQGATRGESCLAG